MAASATKPMTAAAFREFLQRPENRGRRFELERGEIVEMTKPGKFHGFVCANIVALLWIFARTRKKGYACSNDTGLVVEQDPDTVRGPDILFFEDFDAPGQIERKFGEKPPSLAIEVLSPRDTHGKLMRRVQEQLDFGTPLVWVVDPEAENVTVYRPGQAPSLVESHEEITGQDVLPDLRLKVAEFFQMPSSSQG